MRVEFQAKWVRDGEREFLGFSSFLGFILPAFMPPYRVAGFPRCLATSWLSTPSTVVPRGRNPTPP
jgi:hypothetical protein